MQDDDSKKVDPQPAADAGTTTTNGEQPKPEQPKQTQAIARRSPFWDLKVETSFKLCEMTNDALYGLARELSAAIELLPKPLQGKPDNIFAILLRGAEFGLSAMTAISDIMIVEGKVTMAASLQKALVLRSGKCKSWRLVESTKERAVIEVWRVGWETPSTVDFTIEEAYDLGLPDRGRDEYAKARNPWNTQRKNMLVKRCTTRCVREHFGDVMIAFDPEELDVEETQVSDGVFLQKAPPSWGKPPVERPDDDVPDLTPPTEEAFEPTPSMIVDRFVAAAEACKEMRELDEAFGRITSPLVRKAESGDRDAAAAQQRCEAMHATHRARIRKLEKQRPKSSDSLPGMG